MTTDDDTKPFPIQAGKPCRDDTGAMIYPKSSTIPWWLAEVAYEHYKTVVGTSSHLQSLERLAERGGFGRKELVCLLRQSELL